MEPASWLRDANRRRHEQLRRRGRLASTNRWLCRVVPEAGPHGRWGNGWAGVWLADRLAAWSEHLHTSNNTTSTRLLHWPASLHAPTAVSLALLRSGVVYSRVARYHRRIWVVQLTKSWSDFFTKSVTLVTRAPGYYKVNLFSVCCVQLPHSTVWSSWNLLSVR